MFWNQPKKPRLEIGILERSSSIINCKNCNFTDIAAVVSQLCERFDVEIIKVTENYDNYYIIMSGTINNIIKLVETFNEGPKTVMT